MTYDNSKSHKKPEFHPLFRREIIFWKITGASPLPTAVLGIR